MGVYAIIDTVKENTLKQKYTLIRDNDQNRLIIEEYAELDKDQLSLLCEESYDQGAIQTAIAAGPNELTSLLRTNNLYPPGNYMAQIVDGVIALFAPNAEQSRQDVLLDDREALELEMSESSDDLEEIKDDIAEDIDADADEFDALLDENSTIKKLKTFIKSSSDAEGDSDDDS